MIKTIISTIFSILISSFAAQNAHGANMALRPENHLTISYWNDNFDYEKLVGEKMKYGLDDFVTASFWVNYAVTTKRRLWNYDGFLHIITNREAGYRTDLLCWKISTEYAFYRGKLTLGAGLAASGDFGGKEIQNEYHRFASHLPVNLPYAYKSQKSVCWEIDYYLPLLQATFLNAAPFVSVFNSPNVGVNSAKIGGMIEVEEWKFFRLITIYPSAVIYHTEYYGLSREFSPIFQSGLAAGGKIHFNLGKNLGSAVWAVSNQYRNDQSHIGIIITYGQGQESGWDFLMFP